MDITVDSIPVMGGGALLRIHDSTGNRIKIKVVNENATEMINRLPQIVDQFIKEAV